MRAPRWVGWSAVTAFGLLWAAVGCGGKPAAVSKSEPANSSAASPVAASSAPSDGGPRTTSEDSPRRTYAPVRLGGSGDAGVGRKPGNANSMNSVLDAMQPLQVVLGKWRGVTQKPIEGSVKVEEPEWVWDFRSQRDQPALVVNSGAGPFFKTGRMTFLTSSQEFQFTAEDKDGVERVYRGTFTEPVQDVPGDDGKKLQRTFKLTMKQVKPEEDRKLAQVVFAQQENNRYLFEVYDRRGENMLKVNTVANQRQGTSFALNPDDYGEKTCVVSGGLGTSRVSHKGKTYYVCCSGCQAAFNDDPECWIAKFEEANAKK